MERAVRVGGPSFGITWRFLVPDYVLCMRTIAGKVEDSRVVRAFRRTLPFLDEKRREELHLASL